MNNTQNTRVDAFLEHIKRHYPVFAKSIITCHNNRPDLFKELAEPILTWVEKYLGPEKYCESLAKGYTMFMLDIIKATNQYEKTGSYECKSFEEVAEITYKSREFMDFYHWAVVASTFAWEHHLSLYKYFRDNFFIYVTENEITKIIDLGCGSGLWHLLLKNNMHSSQLTINAIDISNTSIEYAKNMAKAANLDSNINYHCCNALDFRDSSLNNLAISCFVLEHLEKPNLLFKSLYDNLLPAGYAFVTAAITAPEIDHIYEFRAESTVIKMAEDEGFRMISSKVFFPNNYPKDHKFLPRSMGVVLQKKQGQIW